MTWGSPRRLFEIRASTTIPDRSYDVSLDGKRFLMIKSASTDTTATPADMVAVLNWTEELRGKFKK